MQRIKSWIIGILTYSSPEFPVPVGSCLSPLDVKSSEIASSKTQELWDKNARAFSLLVRALNHFMGGELGDLLLRKGLNLALENRMRFLALEETPPISFSPKTLAALKSETALDGLAAELLGISQRNPGFKVKLLHFIGAFLQIGAFLAQLLSEIFRCRGGLQRQKFKVGSGNVGNTAIWKGVIDELKRTELYSSHALCFIDESPGQGYNPGNGLPLYSINSLRINPWRYLSNSLPAGIYLFCVLVFYILRYALDPLKLEAAREAAFQARQAIKFMRVKDNFNFAYYLDIAEYTATHIVKAMVLGQDGTVLTRWPHCMIWGAGGFVSFFGYGLYMSSGNFEKNNFLPTWRKDSECLAVGLLFRSPLLSGEDRVLPIYNEKVSTHIAKGGKIITFFGLSGSKGTEEITQTMLEETVKAIQDNKDWLLVLKFKRYASFVYHWPYCQNISGLQELRQEGRLILIEYPNPGEENCSSVWLIEKMDIGVGMGSVQIEAAASGKPVLSYSPHPLKDKLNAKLVGNHLDFQDREGFAQALSEWMQRPDESKIEKSWFQENFDSFNDDAALTRVVQRLWGH